MYPKLLGNPVVAWRDETTLQIGWGAHSLVVESAPAGLPQWLAMINGGRPRTTLLAVAGSCGVDPDRATSLLRDLARHGLLESPPGLQVALHPAGLIDEPFRNALRAVGVQVVPSAGILVFPQGQVPSLLSVPVGARRLIPVWFSARAVHVGPVLDERSGPCPKCVERTWADTDANWAAITAQAVSVPVWQEPAQLYLAAAAIAHIADAPSTVGLEMVFDPDHPGPAWRVWHAHAGCECHTSQRDVPDTPNGGH